MHDNYDLEMLMGLVEERKFRALREILIEMNEVDIAEFLDELDVEQEILVFRLLPKDLAAEVFSYLEEDQEKLRYCIQSLKEVGDTVNVEYRVRHTDGRLLHVMGSIKLMEEDGELIYQRFLLDCTAQKLREQLAR